MHTETEHLTAWEETTGAVARRPASGALATPHSEPSRSPAVSAEIIRLLTPALALVAPVGMDEEGQTTWFAAACGALRGYSGAEIARGVTEAMRKADHPAKVVPLIVQSIEAMQWGRDTGPNSVNRYEPRIPHTELPAPADLPVVWTQVEVDAANATFRKLGLETRYALGPSGELVAA